MSEREPQTADKYIVRFPEGLRQRLKEVAQENGRSLNAEIILRLQQSFEGGPSAQQASEYRQVLSLAQASITGAALQNARIRIELLLMRLDRARTDEEKAQIKRDLVDAERERDSFVRELHAMTAEIKAAEARSKHP
jgi:hypothetical protein